MSLEKIINGIKKAKSALKSLSYSAVIGASLLTGSVKAELPEYEVTEIKVPGMVHAINNQGMILSGTSGREYPIPPKNYIFLDGAVRKIEGEPNEPYFRVIKINDFGEALVNKRDYSIRPSILTSYIWKLGKVIELDFLGEDISNTEVVGFNQGIYPDEYVAYRFLLENNQKIEIGSFSPCFVNDKGQIAGYKPSVGPVVWENGILKKLEELSDTLPVYSEIRDINNKGKVVGYVFNYSKMYAAMWDENEKLNILDSTSDGSEAIAINDDDQIVGSFSYKFMGQTAVLYQKDEQNNILKINLNNCVPRDSLFVEGEPYRERLLSALDINKKGQIICEGYLKYFLLTPKPKPSADLNKDGIVNLEDLAIVGEHWLEER
jgi:hypothetical protein